MRFIEGKDGEIHTLYLSRRNLQALLDKLDDPLSRRTLQKDGISVTAIADEAIIVAAEEDDEHYQGETPGIIYMPTAREYR